MADTPVADKKKSAKKAPAKKPAKAEDMKDMAEANLDSADTAEGAVVEAKTAKKPVKQESATVVATNSGGHMDIPLDVASKGKKDANSHAKAGLEAPPDITIPEGKVGESSLEQARRVLQGTKGKANAIRQWMTKTGFPFVKDVDDSVSAEGTEFLEMPIEVTVTGDNGEKVIVMKSAGQVRNEFAETIDRHLNWPEDGVVGRLILRAAHSAKILFELSQAKSLPELHGVLATIYEDGYLDEAPNGQIRGPGGKNYTLTTDKRFGELGNDETTAREVADLVITQSARFRTEFFRDAKEVERRLTEKSEMSVADLCGGQVVGNGFCALRITAHAEYRDEGILQVRLDGEGRIWPMAGSGRLQEGVAALQNSKAFITLESLVKEDGSLEERPPRFNSRVRLGEMEFKKWLGLRIKFWHWIRQGIGESLTQLEKKARIEETRQAKVVRIQEVKDALTDDQPLIDEGKWLAGNNGDTILVIEDWRDKDSGALYPLIVVRVRRETEDKEEKAHSVVSIVNASPECEEFFDGVTGKYAEGECFRGVKDPLRRLLRAAYGMKFGSGARK
ncbi:hypothetical protein A3A21_00610 [Candidatus Jorgensenbacteria bacterium RIFCSPLOWO2_01_FULL_45_25b]|uniref:Uncharacterized protein n=1 Tax=Candidatus Jorgensenbacteria bacterium RIFCSPLOWO2_01_FULL_45_25b TaxID=1798471 RepID=A0A1F6BUD4_9BACT|nr:MAG: hypothetical protein A3A21_00610 [Candidatus Jorgensenbacteria bacterium RIFCSPLOWO2_01_FULL_45_25b]